MKKLDIETFQKQIIPELYSFAFVLVPDDLQASQIAIDASVAVAKRSEEQLRSLDSTEISNEDYRAILSKYKVTLYKEIFTIGRRRFTQLRNSLQVSGQFYKLKFIARSALFLKHKTELSIGEISEVLSISEHDLSREIIEGQDALQYNQTL